MMLIGRNQSIYDTMLQFFTEDDWRYDRIEGKPFLKMGFKGESGSWRCFAQAREEQKQFVFYSVLDVNVPEDKRAAMAEFITRANYNLILGNFEMDFDDGEIRYKTCIDFKCEDARVTTGILKNAVYMNVIMTDKYFSGVMSVIYAGVKAKDAVDKCEATKQ